MSEKKLKQSEVRAREPEKIWFAVSETTNQLGFSALPIYATGKIITAVVDQFKDVEFLDEALKDALEEELNEVEDRGLWIWDGFPIFFESSEKLDLTDGKFRRPTQEELEHFVFGPSQEELEKFERGEQEEHHVDE